MAAPSGMSESAATGPAAVTSALPSKVAAPPATFSISFIFAQGADLSTCADQTYCER